MSGMYFFFFASCEPLSAELNFVILKKCPRQSVYYQVTSFKSVKTKIYDNMGFVLALTKKMSNQIFPEVHVGLFYVIKL